MERKLLCALLVCLASTSVGATATAEDIEIPQELSAEKTSFAYRVKHSAHPLPKAALDAPSISSDHALPWVTAAERTVDITAAAARHNPSRTALCSQAAAVAEAHKLPAPFFANLLQQESGFKAHVVSPVGAQGIAQFMPRVARAYGLENPFDPIHSMTVSAKFLRELLGQFGNLGLAAAAYNAGPRRVQDWLNQRGKLPEETRNYVRNITGQPAERWARVNAPTEGKVLPAHARCPGLPVMEVSVPEAAPVMIAKGKVRNGKATLLAAAGKADVKAGDRADARATGKDQSRLAAALAEGPKMALIKRGSIKIIAAETGAKKLEKVAAKIAKDADAAPRKGADTKTARSLAKPVAGKRVKVAAAR
jgi:hypothetical protein